MTLKLLPPSSMHWLSFDLRCESGTTWVCLYLYYNNTNPKLMTQSLFVTNDKMLIANSPFFAYIKVMHESCNTKVVYTLKKWTVNEQLCTI